MDVSSNGKGSLWEEEHSNEEKMELKEIILGAYPENRHRLDDDRLSFLLGWLGRKHREVRLKVLLNLWNSKYFYPCLSLNKANDLLKDNPDDDLLIRLSNTVPGSMVMTIRKCHVRSEKIKKSTNVTYFEELDAADKSFVNLLRISIYNQSRKMMDPVEYRLTQ